jgi:uncharacterized protein (TIGR02246 family)
VIILSGLTTIDNDTVEEFVRYWESVFDQGDYQAMAEYYTKNATLIATQLNTLNGRAEIERFWQTACKGALKAQIKRVVHVAEIGDDRELAFIRGTVTLATPDQQVPTIIRYVTLWRREEDSRWRITVDISSPEPLMA